MVVEPTLDQLLEAQTGWKQVSFQARLCFVVARDGGRSVLTNDTALRKVCERAGIPCMWGMEAMVFLVEEKCLGPARAMAVAEKMARANSFINNRILERFRTSIGL